MYYNEIALDRDFLFVLWRLHILKLWQDVTEYAVFIISLYPLNRNRVFLNIRLMLIL